MTSPDQASAETLTGPPRPPFGPPTTAGALVGPPDPQGQLRRRDGGRRGPVRRRALDHQLLGDRGPARAAPVARRPVHPGGGDPARSRRTACRPTGSSTGRSPGCSSTSGCSSSRPTRPSRCSSGPATSPSSRRTSTSSSWSASPASSAASPPGSRSAPTSGLEPREVLEQISLVSHELLDLQAQVYRQQVKPALEEEGINIVRWDELSDAERATLSTLYSDQIFPVLTPARRRPGPPVPVHLRALAQPRRRPHQPQDRQGALRPGQGAAAAAPAPAGRATGR